MSAIRLEIAGNLAIGFPNCWRVRAYSIEPSRSRSITPTLNAKRQVRSQSIEWAKSGKPPPTPPRTALSGTRTSSRTTSPSGEVRSPSFSILGDTWTPGVFVSIRKAVLPP
jgi:hypothetical protein